MKNKLKILALTTTAILSSSCITTIKQSHVNIHDSPGALVIIQIKGSDAQDSLNVESTKVHPTPHPAIIYNEMIEQDWKFGLAQ